MLQDGIHFEENSWCNGQSVFVSVGLLASPPPTLYL